jgi:hypothetical protein
MDLFLPVSLGEAFDKLSILDIKRSNIIDSRKIEVVKEYNILYKILESKVNIYKELYTLILQTNQVIWNQMDILRDGNLNEDDYSKLCRDCISTNDVRFRIKNKINLISNSFIKEQKSYIPKQININISNNKLDIIEQVKLISLSYDNVNINSTIDIQSYFSYDNTISFNLPNNGDTIYI